MHSWLLRLLGVRIVVDCHYFCVGILTAVALWGRCMELVLWYVGSEVKGALREVVEDARWNV